MVTGASSGIGKEITTQLAKQNINVVMVALDDKLLEESFNELKNKFNQVKFVKCGCNLGDGNGYMDKIIESTKDLQINLVFNNAGFIITDFFQDIPIEKIMANYECNATSMVKITHHFLNQFKINAFKKSAIIFTSSPSNIIPNPTSALYGSTKAFVTEFGASIAPEVKDLGVDILVVHPSPVDSGFWSQAKKLDAIEMFKKTAASPVRIVNAIFTSLGRTTVRDEGYFPVLFKLLVKLIDFNILTDIITFTGKYTSDFKKLRQKKLN